LEYSDNVRVEARGESGLIGTVGLRFDGKYQFTEIQDLSDPRRSLEPPSVVRPGENRNLVSMAPDSMVRFNASVSEVRLTAFLEYRRQLDPVLSPVVNNTAILDQRALTTGLQADLPIDKGNIQASVLHEYRNRTGDDALSRCHLEQYRVAPSFPNSPRPTRPYARVRPTFYPPWRVVLPRVHHFLLGHRR
jgi:hypothetical protein